MDERLSSKNHHHERMNKEWNQRRLKMLNVVASVKLICGAHYSYLVTVNNISDKLLGAVGIIPRIISKATKPLKALESNCYCIGRQ